MPKPVRDLCLYLQEPTSPYAEAVRTLRFEIFQLMRKGRKCLLISSSWPHDGKSTTCINLAVCVAEVGHKVLLVDGDLRQRSLSQALLASQQGLAQLHSTFIEESGLTGVWIAPTGDTQDCIPSELLVQPEIKSRFADFRAQFDLVIVDSPPLSACRDALLLGSHCDGAIMVASTGKFRGIPEGHFCEDLREHGVEILGIIATG